MADAQKSEAEKTDAEAKAAGEQKATAEADAKAKADAEAKAAADAAKPKGKAHVVTGAAVVLATEGGSERYLYRGATVGSGFTKESIDHALSLGLIKKAK